MDYPTGAFRSWDEIDSFLGDRSESLAYYVPYNCSFTIGPLISKRIVRRHEGYHCHKKWLTTTNYVDKTPCFASNISGDWYREPVGFLFPNYWLAYAWKLKRWKHDREEEVA